MCARVRVYLILVGKPPDPGSHFGRKDEEQEEEELRGTNKDVELEEVAAALCAHTDNTHQSQHARRLLHGSAAAEEAHHHHESPGCDQDVDT